MYCPDCGNNCGNSRFCSACGKEMISSNDDLDVTKLLGTYEGLDGYIEIDFCTVTIHKDRPIGPIISTFLYEDISYVDFSQASGNQLGYLSIRDKNHDAIVTSETDAVADDLAILFDGSRNEAFTEIFCFLNQFARKWVRDHRGHKKWDPLYIRNFHSCPRCGSTRRLWYTRGLGHPKNSRSIHFFECLKCSLKLEWQ